MGTPTPSGRGPRLFGALGRWIVRHPWYPIILGVVLLAVTVPFLSLIGSVEQSSASSLPASAPSALAAAELARLFPDQPTGSSAYLLFTAPDMTGASAQGVILALTGNLTHDPQLTYVASIATVYTAYAGYLSGQVEIAGDAIAQSGSTTLLGVNASAAVLWSPPAQYVGAWQGLVANGSAPSAANGPAYAEVAARFANGSAAREVLDAFYNGYDNDGAGFNGTARCADAPAAVVACADAAARTNVAPLIGTLPPAERSIATVTLAQLGVENWTSWPSVRAAAAYGIGEGVGYPGPWVDAVWSEFPSGAPSPAAASAWANATVAVSTLASEPLPVPYSIRSAYVAGAGTAQLIVVSFTVGDSYTDAAGSHVVYADLGAIGRQVGATLDAVDPMRTITYYQTGPAPLDLAQSNVLDSAIQLVLPVTVGLLIGITAVYFRSPVTPLCAFAGLAISLVLGLGAVVLVGSFVTHVDPTTLTLEDVFVLGVGTDYSIFLIARYREELVHGRSSNEAVVASLTWAGQSVATSGSTAVIATLALAFSGVALLSEWGMVLSIAVAITVVISLTVTPAILTLVGPRIFWPGTRARFERRAARERARKASESTYFFRVGRLAQRRPLLVIGLVLLVSVPLLLVALQVPISYDYYSQLPANQPAVEGLAELGHQFGPGFAFLSYALVTFEEPLLANGTPNLNEFSALSELGDLATNTSGIQAVQSLVGPYGAPQNEWANYPLQPSAVQQNLNALLSTYVGSDGRTVLIVLQTNASGLSSGAIGSVQRVESSFEQFASAQSPLPGAALVRSMAFGGAAPTTSDLAAQTLLATERLILAVAIGLIAVLFLVLRSWIIPLMAVATIALSIGWSWALTYLVLGRLAGLGLFFFVPTLLFILILGLGIDYNIFLLTRVREERLKGRPSSEAVVQGVAQTGGIITAAAAILASAFASLLLGQFALLIAIGFSVAVAVLLDAMIVRTFLVPAALQKLGERVWQLGRRTAEPAPTMPEPPSG